MAKGQSIKGEYLLIRRIDEILDLEIESYYKTIIIKKLINDWRGEE